MIDFINTWVTWGAPVYFFIFIFPLLFVYPSISLFIVLLFTIRWYIRGTMYNGKARDITGETVVITGGNTGIGKETARDLAKRGAKVIILCRDLDRGQAAAKDIYEDTGKEVLVRKLDLASLESVRQCAALLKKEELKIHTLINNAGVMTTSRQETQDGFEMHLGTNHYGHFLLTLLLLDNLKAAAPSRVINVSALLHAVDKIHWDDLDLKTGKFSHIGAYAQSKLANILFTRSLAKKLKSTLVSTYSLHPGVITTELTRQIEAKFGRILKRCVFFIRKFFVKDAMLGAQTTIACAVDEELFLDTGKYYSECKQKHVSSDARNDADAERLWNISLKAVGLEGLVI